MVLPPGAPFELPTFGSLGVLFRTEVLSLSFWRRGPRTASSRGVSTSSSLFITANVCEASFPLHKRGTSNKDRRHNAMPTQFTRGDVISESFFLPKSTGGHDCESGKQCLHSDPNGLPEKQTSDLWLRPPFPCTPIWETCNTTASFLTTGGGTLRVTVSSRSRLVRCVHVPSMSKAQDCSPQGETPQVPTEPHGAMPPVVSLDFQADAPFRKRAHAQVCRRHPMIKSASEFKFVSGGSPTSAHLRGSGLSSQAPEQRWTCCALYQPPARRVAC